MHTVNIEIAQDVKEFIQQVAKVAQHFNVYLVGGYLRDNYNARSSTIKALLYQCEPKDVDIVLVPKVGMNVEVPLEAALGTLLMYSSDASDISDMEERGVYKLIGLRNYKLSTKDIQFIVYSLPMSQKDVVLDMDMNVVQAIWNPLTDETIVSDAFLKGHEDKVIECLHDYDKERMFVRYERMEKKLRGYNTLGKPKPPAKNKIKRVRLRHSGSV